MTVEQLGVRGEQMNEGLGRETYRAGAALA